MIHIRDLEFRYGQKPVFNRLNLHISNGSISGLLGLNGAGKTTLLRLLCGQLFPHEGLVDVLGFTPAKRQADFLREIYYVPDELFLPDMTGTTYVKMLTPFYPRFDHEYFDKLCQEFELDNTRKLPAYSYGQQKKFILAFGLATMASLLLMDEPTNGLDIPSKTQFRRAVSAAITPERAFVISTHQVRDLENLIDPIIIVHNGHIIFHQDTESIASQYSLNHEFGSQEPQGALYSGQIPGGWASIHLREKDDDRPAVDLETLFNAVISRPATFQNTYQRGVL